MQCQGNRQLTFCYHISTSDVVNCRAYNSSTSLRLIKFPDNYGFSLHNCQMWIERDISDSIQNNSNLIQVVWESRKCGKSSLFLHLDLEFQEVSLDDPSFRELAQNDFELFLRQFDTQKLFIEAKTSPKQINQSSKYPEFKKVFNQKQSPLFICHQEGLQILNGNIPLAKLKEFLLNEKFNLNRAF